MFITAAGTVFVAILTKHVCMDRNLLSLDLNTLKVMYEREADELNAALINGISWDQLREQRKNVTELSIALQAKRTGDTPPVNNPAERSTRKERRKS